MQIDDVDIRRLFRNRFEIYWDTDFTYDGTGIDGSKLTLADCCEKLRTDQECFPVQYHLELRFLYMVILRCCPPSSPTYGDVARSVLDLLAIIKDSPASACLRTNNSSSRKPKPASELLGVKQRHSACDCQL